MTIKTYLLKIKQRQHLFLLFSVLFLALFFRTFGIDWDQGQHLHPDERFLTMVLTTIKIPSSIGQYLDPKISTLNPYNNNFSFFVYGTFPLNLVKIVGELLNQTSYDQIHFVGRYLTAIVDVLVVLLIYLISKKVFNKEVGLLAAFIYSVCVLPIQLAHFYTVDPFLNLFIVLSFYLLILIKDKKNIFTKIILLSLCFALAIACKISAIYFSPTIAIFLLVIFFKQPKKLFLYGFIFIFFTSIFFRINQPQSFSSANFLNWNLNPQFISNIKELQDYNKASYYPPGIQWLKTTPLIFPLKNIVFWGAGLPLGIIFVVSIFYAIYYLFKEKTKKNFCLSMIIFWILLLFFYQGSQHVTTMRYFLPIYPFLCLLSAFSISKLKIFRKLTIKILLVVLLLIYPCCFISIYFRDHTRIAASKWIYQNISIGSTIATEYWDDGLPLSIGENSLHLYQYQSLAVADPDSSEKMSIIKDQLNKSDYIVLSSNRFYLPITKNSDSYPLTANYYQSLFDGSLGFQKIAEFTSYPVFDDTYAEEAFSVYDHPKVVIFKKTTSL